MADFVITEVDLKDECKHLRYIRLSLAFGSKGFYRQATSFDAWRNRRNHKPSSKKPEITYVSQFTEDWELSQKLVHDTFGKLGLNNPHDGVPEIVAKDVWAFYKMIGYNYKEKSYQS